MQRLTVKRPGGRWAIANNDNASPKEQMLKIPLVIDRLAAYEDLEEQGRLVVLPEVAKKDRENFADYLHDCFMEASLYDPSVGIFGMTDGEKALADALMQVFAFEEAERALAGGADHA